MVGSPTAHCLGTVVIWDQTSHTAVWTYSNYSPDAYTAGRLVQEDHHQHKAAIQTKFSDITSN
jgi:hypothetical protein